MVITPVVTVSTAGHPLGILRTLPAFAYVSHGKPLPEEALTHTTLTVL